MKRHAEINLAAVIIVTVLVVILILILAPQTSRVRSLVAGVWEKVTEALGYGPPPVQYPGVVRKGFISVWDAKAGDVRIPVGPFDANELGQQAASKNLVVQNWKTITTLPISIFFDQPISTAATAVLPPVRIRYCTTAGGFFKGYTCTYTETTWCQGAAGEDQQCDIAD
ncbi:MAG: hypothetical protein AABY13_05700, partial [Nanoarchaeota archaeon]